MNHYILLNYCTLWHLFEWSTALRIECFLIVRLPLMLAEIFNHFDSFHLAKSFFWLKIIYTWLSLMIDPYSFFSHCLVAFCSAIAIVIYNFGHWPEDLLWKWLTFFWSISCTSALMPQNPGNIAVQGFITIMVILVHKHVHTPAIWRSITHQKRDAMTLLN